MCNIHVIEENKMKDLLVATHNKHKTIEFKQMANGVFNIIDLYDAGKGILAREVLKKALLDAEEQVISQDIIPDEPIGSTDPAES